MTTEPAAAIIAGRITDGPTAPGVTPPGKDGHNPLDWPPRPRGQACPACGALVGYGPDMEEDKVTHNGWHQAIDELLASLTAFTDTSTEAIAKLVTKVVPDGA